MRGNPNAIHWLWRQAARPNWPTGAARGQFVMNYEEGSEPSGAGWGRLYELGLRGAWVDQASRADDLAGESMFENGSRMALAPLPPVHRAGIAMTVFGLPLALERNPRAADAIRAAG